LKLHDAIRDFRRTNGYSTVMLIVNADPMRLDVEMWEFRKKLEWQIQSM